MIKLMLSCLFSASIALAATPQEVAFLRVWQTHCDANATHRQTVDACQKAMDKVSTTGEFLPVVKTIAAWHLLADGRSADAARFFESALFKKESQNPLARLGDGMAKRWLSRMDAERFNKPLRSWYASHVEYPQNLAPIFALPNPPPKTDRFGEPWIYKLESFGSIAGTAGQKFSLYSKSTGREKPLKKLLSAGYAPGRSAKLIAVKTATPLTLQFESTANGKTVSGVAGEGRAVNGARFLRLSSDKTFALMADIDGDWWILARKQGRQ